MTMDDFINDMTARAFANYAESNPRLKELAEKDSAGIATEEEEDEFFRLLDKAENEFFDDDDAYADSLTPAWDDPIWEESPVDLFGPWWE